MSICGYDYKHLECDEGICWFSKVAVMTSLGLGSGLGSVLGMVYLLLSRSEVQLESCWSGRLFYHADYFRGS